MAFLECGKRQIIAMIHAGALPGTPRASASVGELASAAAKEAGILAKAGVDAVIIENMHDRPYIKGEPGPEITAAMTRIAAAVREASGLPCGIQILAGGNRAALAVAQAAGCDFIRAEGFVFAHVADEGIIESCAGDLLRFRRQIGAENIQIIADIKKKHSAHAVTADVDIAETAKAAEFFSADGVIVTGSATGEITDLEELRTVRNATNLPLCVGSGITTENANRYFEYADALIVGSSLKVDGRWENAVCAERVQGFVSGVR